MRSFFFFNEERIVIVGRMRNIEEESALISGEDG